MNLLGIINDLLDISKIESGKFTMVPVVYDVPSMINDTINLNMVRIGSKPVQFRLHLDGTLPSRLRGDELRVKQVFNNLLSNAFKYTDSGYVDWTINCQREGDRFRVTSTVQDTGMGIRREDQDKLFKDYYQANLHANYYVEGTGLGLSITNNLVKLMGGSVKVKSEYGKGSIFTVEFFQESLGDETIGSEAAENLSQFRYSAQRRTRNQKLPRADMSYATVLVVDDVVTNLDVARGMMKPYGIAVDCVTSGEEAIKRIREEKVRYSAIFMDHMMPGMDGIETVRIIRREIGTEYAKNIPVIALTANALLGSDSLFLENGFQAFLSKPIDILRLNNILNQWVRDKKQERQPLPGQAPNGEQKTPDAGVFTNAVIPGLTVSAGFARFGNDAESYLRVLQSYTNHTPALLETVRKAAPEGLAEYRIAVHSVKGSSRGIGAEELGNMAEKLETAAVQGDWPFIEANNARLVARAEEILAGIRAFLRTVPEAQQPPKPEKESPEPEALAALRQAVEKYDMAALQEAINALDAFSYRSQPDLTGWLREQAGRSDFAAIQKRLDQSG
jgi:CheY-like chemotaxis protein